MNCERVKIGDLYSVYNGLAKGREFFGKGYPFISFSVVFNNYFIPENIEALVDSTVSEREKYSIKRGDILITRTSETSDELAMTSVALQDIPDATYNGFSKRLRPKTDRILPEYIGYYLRSFEFRKHFLGITGSMTTRASLRNEFLEDIEIPVPTLAKQKSISDVLRNYDLLIVNYNKQIALLEEAAQRLYREWFVDFRFPGYENVEFNDGLPGGWKKLSLSEMDIELESGGRPKGGVSNIQIGVPSIGAENVIGLGKYNFSSEKLIPEEYFNTMKRGVLQDRDILIYKDGAYIGRTSLFQDGFPHAKAAVNEHVFLLRATDEKLQYYIFFTLYQTSYFNLMQGLNANSAQPGLNQANIMGIPMVLPTGNLIEKFNSIIESMMKSIFAFANQIRLLTEARDLLLPRLMSGEIEIKE